MLDADGKMKRIEVVAFLEPPEYQPSERWYDQFAGKKLEQNLRLSGEIHPVTGATLTAKATTEAVRRVLAIDQMLLQKEAEAKQP
jgi:Na+-translocating ferredoxin:NAD+ oxidoreductase RnfG subunit